MTIIKYLINPATALICFAIAMVFFRKRQVTIGEALMLPLRRAALDFKFKFTDAFTSTGIAFLIAGSLIALLDVSFF